MRYQTTLSVLNEGKRVKNGIKWIACRELNISPGFRPGIKK